MFQEDENSMISRRTIHCGLAVMAAAALSPHRAGAQSISPPMAAIDSHAHVFRRGLALTEGRRYAPEYDATPEDYIKALDANGMTNAVLVQPSFLGTDNSYLVSALRRYPDRFRGVAVVDRDTAADELKELAAAGVVGIRLNLVGQQDPELTTGPWQSFLKRLADLRWQVEIQAEARRWPVLLDPLLDAGLVIVADHFGKPDASLGVDDPGFRYLLASGRSGRVYVKLSGSYRNGDRLPAAAIPSLRESLGLDHLVWGSDWPHTQFEKVTNYHKVRSELDEWLPDVKDRKIILLDTPRRLFWDRTI